MLIFLSFLWVNAEKRVSKGSQILKFVVLFQCFFFFELIVVSVSTSEDMVYGFWVNLDCRSWCKRKSLLTLIPGIAVYRLLCKLGLLWLGSFLNSLNMDGWSSSGPFRNIWQPPAFKMDSITRNIIFFQ